MKNSSIENRFCMSLVAFAVIVRLLLATGAAAAVVEECAGGLVADGGVTGADIHGGNGVGAGLRIQHQGLTGYC
mgnify:CR=1 FL=1